MLKNEDINYFNNGDIENKKFWRRIGSKPNFKNKKVLDFGCGHGSLVVDIAKSGAQKVIGVDLNKRVIDFAKENLKKNYSVFKDIVEFHNEDILRSDKFKDFDYIITKDTFEHTLNLDKVLFKFYEMLRDDGKVYTGFGPLYNFYNGDHGRLKAVFPWFHLIIPEKILIKRINKTLNYNIKRIEDLGLNKFSVNDYMNVFNRSKFQIFYLRKNLSDNPISILFNFLCRFSLFRKYCTFNIYCILKK